MMSLWKSYPLLARSLIFLILPALVGATIIFHHFRSSVPHDESIVVAGILEPATISRDSYGIVSIDAKTDQDAFFALGYAQAQDRMWQLELQRRIASGTLSELFGGATLNDDIWMRTLGLYASAEAELAGMDPEARRSLDSYAAGVNAWLNSEHALPVEFSVFQFHPRPWRDVDSLAWSKVFALNLAGNMWQEISNATLKKYLTPDVIFDLLGRHVEQADYAEQNSVSGSDASSSSLLAVKHDMENAWSIGGRFVGSNAWAISGKLTKNGHALLASDPHLSLQIPSIWYAAKVNGDRLHVSGMSLVGLPIIVFGKNNDIAWGGTSLEADVQDLMIERLNPSNPGQYERRGHWLNFETHEEVVNVRRHFLSFLFKKDEPVVIHVRRTIDGPVISDIDSRINGPLTLKWTGLAQDDHSYESLLAVNYATDWQDFQHAFRGYVAPAMNMAFVDRNDNIGSLSVGRIPIRKKGNGDIPHPAPAGEFEWTGFIPFEDMPLSFNPDIGYIVSANTDPAPPGYPYHISNAFAPSYRKDRISDLIVQNVSRSKKIDIDYVERMQNDQVDVSVTELLAELMKYRSRSARQQRALNSLSTWRGDMSASSVPASIYFVWVRHLRQKLFGAAIKQLPLDLQTQPWVASIISNTSYAQVNAALANGRWCAMHDAALPRCNDIESAALDDALDEILRLAGPKQENWAWGRIHKLVLKNAVFSDVQLVAPFFDREYSAGGSENTISVADSQYKAGANYEQHFGSGFRQIVQMNGTSTAQYLLINSTGQSGNAFDSNYDNLSRLYISGHYIDISSLKEKARVRTELTPKRGWP